MMKKMSLEEQEEAREMDELMAHRKEFDELMASRNRAIIQAGPEKKIVEFDFNGQPMATRWGSIWNPFGGKIIIAWSVPEPTAYVRGYEEGYKTGLHEGLHTERN